MPGHWLIVTPKGHRVRRGTIAPRGLTSRMPGRLEVGRRAIVAGPIRIRGSLLAEPFARIQGDVRTEARCVIGAGGRVTGGIQCGADLHLLPGVRVDRDVHAEADLHIHQGVLVHGDASAGGDLIVHGPARTGSIRCGGRVCTRTSAAPPVAFAAERAPNLL